MILVFLNFILFALASMCNSIMDTLDHHQSKSIFTKFKNQKWWNADSGWKNKYVDYDGDIKKGIEPRRVKWKILGIEFNKPVQLTDAWHFFKMWMIIFLALSVMTFAKCVILNGCEYQWYTFLAILFTYGIIWNSTFSLFYEKILIKKS